MFANREFLIPGPCSPISAFVTVAFVNASTNWKLTLAYDGSGFHGWQIQSAQSGLATIQGTLSEAICACGSRGVDRLDSFGAARNSDAIDGMIE